jgi:hypothetical protein
MGNSRLTLAAARLRQELKADRLAARGTVGLWLLLWLAMVWSLFSPVA